MPRRSKGPRLYERKRKDRASVWVIRDDGDIEISTGEQSRREAEKKLAQYISSKHRPSGPTSPEELTLSQVLLIYIEEHAPTVESPERIAYAVDALEPFWGNLTVASINGPTCRRYVTHRGVKNSTARRELGVLQAALKYCAREGYLIAAPEVWKPTADPTPERYLTRQEVAWLLRAARNLNADGRHLAKFILTGVYTGTRKSAALALWIDQPSTTGGWIDTEAGVLFRQPLSKKQTKKRQTPARLPNRFLSHVRRWKRRNCRFVVQTSRGNRVGDIKKGWSKCVRLAEEMALKHDIHLDLTIPGSEERYVTPHILRHTCATWLMQKGASVWDAAGYLGMTVEMLERTYGHHHPEHQESARHALEK